MPVANAESRANGTLLIQLEQIGKIYYTDDLETHALSEVHLKIHRGEFVSITGPSGCGKSTLLGILGLLDSPSSGEYPARGDCGTDTRSNRASNAARPGNRLHLPGL